MQAIKVTILGKQIPLKVKDGEVESMKRIADFVDEKFRMYRQELTNQPDSTAMILAALSIAGELFEIRQEIREVEDSEVDLMKQVNSEMEKLIAEFS